MTVSFTSPPNGSWSYGSVGSAPLRRAATKPKRQAKNSRARGAVPATTAVRPRAPARPARVGLEHRAAVRERAVAADVAHRRADLPRALDATAEHVALRELGARERAVEAIDRRRDVRDVDEARLRHRAVPRVRVSIPLMQRRGSSRTRQSSGARSRGSAPG